MSFLTYLHKAVNRENLSSSEAQLAMELIRDSGHPVPKAHPSATKSRRSANPTAVAAMIIIASSIVNLRVDVVFMTRVVLTRRASIRSPELKSDAPVSFRG